MNSLRNYFLRDDGATAVEFAMISLLFVSFLFGIIELSRIFWTLNTLQYAIEDTARYAFVNQGATNADLVDHAAASMAGIQVDTAMLTVTTSTTMISGIQFIEVQGSYVFTMLVPTLTDVLGPLNLTAQARLPYSL